MRQPSNSAAGTPSYWASWLDGICLYLTLLTAAIAFAIPNVAIGVVSRWMFGNEAASFVVLLFTVSIGPVILSRVFRILDGSMSLMSRPMPRIEQNRTATKQEESESKMEKGDLDRCPACGEALTREAVRCPSCELALR